MMGAAYTTLSACGNGFGARVVTTERRRDMLTDKQEHFVQELIKGKSQSEAYREAYNAARMKDKTVTEKASRLLANGNVRARYEELQGKVRAEGEQNAVASAVEVFQELSNIGLGRKNYPVTDAFGNVIDRPVTVTARIKALELLGKYHGAFTDKMEHSGGVAIREDKLASILKELQK